MLLGLLWEALVTEIVPQDELHLDVVLRNKTS